MLRRQFEGSKQARDEEAKARDEEARELKEQVQRYRNESQAEFGRLDEENRQLKREIKGLEAENKQQKKKIKELEEKVERLEEEGKRLEIQVTQNRDKILIIERRSLVNAAREKLGTKYGFTEAQLSTRSYRRPTDRGPERALNRAVHDLVTQLPAGESSRKMRYALC